jgi:hypothetical protein
MPTVVAEVVGDAPARALRVTVSEPTAAVRIWTATAPSRDFRDARWTSVDANRDGDGFRAPLPRPRPPVRRLLRRRRGRGRRPGVPAVDAHSCARARSGCPVSPLLAPIDRVLMAAAILGDPLVPRPAAEHEAS